MCECNTSPTITQSSSAMPMPTPTEPTAAVPTKKRVRFSKNPPKTILFYKHEYDSCWCSSESIQRNKKLCAGQGKEWQAKGYGILLKDVFTNPSRERLDIYVQLPGKDYVRGLENYLSDELKKERSTQRKRLIQAVIDREIEMKLQGNCTQEQIDQELAVISLNHSNCARDFAKRLGMADELAYRLGENPELPRFILGAGWPLSFFGRSSDKSSWASVGSKGIGWIVSGMAAIAIVGSQA